MTWRHFRGMLWIQTPRSLPCVQGMSLLVCFGVFHVPSWPRDSVWRSKQFNAASAQGATRYQVEGNKIALQVPQDGRHGAQQGGLGLGLAAAASSLRLLTVFHKG